MTSEPLVLEEREIEVGDRVVLEGNDNGETGVVVDVYADPTAPERVFARVEFPGDAFQHTNDAGRVRSIRLPPGRIAINVRRLRRVED